MNNFKYLPVLMFLLSITIQAQRSIKTINSGWRFQLENDTTSEAINIPHTWNAEDAFTGKNAYLRGKGIYTRQLKADKRWKDQSVFLKFEGANQQTWVYVNNELAGTHIGGYTAFVMEISHLLKYDAPNELRIEVDNSHHKNIPPLEADFNFYGGIYRDLELIVTGKSHFQMEGAAAGNLIIKTPKVSKEKAQVNISGKYTSQTNDLKKILIEITDPKGAIITRYEEQLTDGEFNIDLGIDEPQLWSPQSPQLYRLKAQLMEYATGKLLDDYSSSFGCRWFEAHPGKGFLLNGKPVKLIGANRHQDFEHMGNAVPNSLHRKDYRMIKEMGANFIRTAHYPQDPEVYKICDELGLLVWTEIPVINDVTDTEAYHENAIRMQREQILQLYNHPSIVFWGYMNEIFIRMVFTANMSESDRRARIKTSVELARKLEAETKRLDSSRLSAMALHQDEVYNTSGIVDIPDVIGWNLYFGWYSQGLDNLGVFLDKQHSKYPNRPLLISEYGPGSDTRIQTNTPKPWDYSEAYQLKSHVSYLNQVMERDYMLGMAAWNFADFGSSGRQDSRPFINQKGLVNFNREPKDIYYYYKARLTMKDFVYNAGKNFEDRFISKTKPVQLKVFSNRDTVELLLDGIKKRSTETIDNIASFEVNLAEGMHDIEVKAGKAHHGRRIMVHYRENLLQNLDKSPLLINVGSHSDFRDEETGEIWIRDQEYSEGSFGFVGGEVFQHSKTKFQGTDADIKNSSREPLFQTMREGLDAYRFDVPGGNYRISLLMTEPNRAATVKNIYNLGADEEKSSQQRRIFEIYINDKLVEQELDLATEYGILSAIELDYIVETGKNLVVKFNNSSGKSIISGIRLEKL